MPTPAPCCSKALRDATTHWPNRNRSWDGIMGDAAHQQRKSDHNDGNAFDLTHDPVHGVDDNLLSRQVINDTRITYVIWNRQIYNRERAGSGWRPYTGTNPHDHHMHVSIRASARDDLAPWPWSGGTPLVQSLPNPPILGQAAPYPGIPLRIGSHGIPVRTAQQRLKERGWMIVVDGIFGARTHHTVVEFQREKHLASDGVIGPKTWAALWLF